MHTEENVPSPTQPSATAFRQATVKRNKQIMRKQRRRIFAKASLFTDVFALCAIGVYCVTMLLLASRSALSHTADLPSLLIVAMAIIGGLLAIGSLTIVVNAFVTGVQFYRQFTDINLVILSRITLLSAVVAFIAAAITASYLALVFYR